MKLDHISLSYGEKIVYKDFSIVFPDNKITCIMGASGCGKTTLLNIIAKTIPYSGRVEGVQQIGYIFQKPLLVPSLTVIGNIELIIKNQIKNKKERRKKAEEILKSVSLEKEARVYPFALSGGMEQRVALARAFAFSSDVLLMDEPFKGLDITLKKNIISLFKNLYLQNPRTVVFVTHDIDEALLLGDKIVVLGENDILGAFENQSPLCDRHLSDSLLRDKIYRLL